MEVAHGGYETQILLKIISFIQAETATIRTNCTYQITFYSFGNSWNTTSVSGNTWQINEIGLAGVYNNAV